MPPLAGLFSATGLLHARAEWHDVRFCRSTHGTPDLGELRRLDAEIRARAIEWQRVADVPLPGGQRWSVAVGLPARSTRRRVVSSSSARGRARALYGTRLEPGSPVDVRALRPGRARSGAGGVQPHAYDRTRARRLRRVMVYFGDECCSRVPVREPLLPRRADRCPGRSSSTSYDTTVVIPPGLDGRARPGHRALVLDGVRLGCRHRTSCRSDRARLVANALETAADEMATTVFRTAHSAVVRDAMDFSAALCGPTGETVAQAVTIPLLLGSIPNAIKTLFEHFGDSFAPGDVFVNEPFDGASHTPTSSSSSRPSGRRADRLRRHVAHHGDVAGGCRARTPAPAPRCPGGPAAPVAKLVERGEPVEAVFEMIANVRTV